MASRSLGSHRVEVDSMGPVAVPVSAYYGASTARAVENFPISGQRMPRHLVRALGLVKGAAARTNRELGLLEPDSARAIELAAAELAEGKLDDHLPVDVFQTGSGTSTHMNVNEVLAHRASELLGDASGSPSVHPNDHVNLGQSSNDVFPTAIHLAVREALTRDLLPALVLLAEALEEKARLWWAVVKTGRTHLMDATPVRLGQEFSGYASQVRHGVDRLARSMPVLDELAIGGTAVGTGLNAHPEFARRVCALLAEASGAPVHPAANAFEAQGARDALVEVSGQVRTVAVSLAKIAGDIRLMGSGPRAGLGELVLPALQPGSSIMPGKVNPVVCESVIQVAAQVVGCDAVVVQGGLGGHFELNAMMPVMAWNLLLAIRLLASASEVFRSRCITGLEVRAEAMREVLEGGLALATALVPVLGHDRVATLVDEARVTGRTIRQVALERSGLDPGELERWLDPLSMCAPTRERVDGHGG